MWKEPRIETSKVWACHREWKINTDTNSSFTCFMAYGVDLLHETQNEYYSFPDLLATNS
jgi:hypothetical protein